MYIASDIKILSCVIVTFFIVVAIFNIYIAV